MSMQKKLAEKQRARPEPVPDLTDLMNDWFYGSAKTERKAYKLVDAEMEKKEEGGGRNSNSNPTEDWLEEAKRMVASSPSRHDMPSRLIGSPRFAKGRGSEPSAALLDRRDPLSRSARRNRSTESFSGEILLKSAKHSRNKSESLEPVADKSPASAVQQWFSNILKPHTTTDSEQKQQDSSKEKQDRDSLNLPPRQPIRPKSRFQDVPSESKPIPSKRTFRTGTDPQNQMLSPPKNLVESTHRRSISSSTCSMEKFSRSDTDLLSLKQLVSCTKPAEDDDVGRLNLFLKERRAKIGRISSGEISAQSKIILSGSPNSTSTIVAAICYAWLLENKEKKEEGWEVVVPVINMKRGRMWKQRQAAWLFQHVGIDVTALLFSDEVDLESLIMARKLSILVVGQDVLKTNNEVGSKCTILTDIYCEDAYNLVQTPYLKKLLLAGILLDTDNLNVSSKLSTNRDREAVQLLLVGSTPNHRHALFDQLMEDHRDNSFLDTMRKNYGNDENGSPTEHRVSVRKSVSNSYQEINMGTSDATRGVVKNIKTKPVSPKSAQRNSTTQAPVPAATQEAQPAPRGKNKNFFAKLFGFGK
ncbi:uncharacterized protein LOC143889984 isoform X2 [Tasmannia lanceolata]|uniref:uncharacterized protein LOC143889984 isoform X2 n=1 Tax=Tasmannia lanceolata TaxID=3420 RepID=UPI00406449A3